MKRSKTPTYAYSGLYNTNSYSGINLNCDPGRPWKMDISYFKGEHRRRSYSLTQGGEQVVRGVRL